MRVRRHYDYSILVLTVILVLFGLLMIYSSSFYRGEAEMGDGLYYFKHQAIGVAVGIVGMVFFMLFDYKKLRKVEYIGVIAALVLLGLVFIPGLGMNLNGSSRWIKIPFFGQFQPSEAAKFAVIIFMAANMSKKQDKMCRYRYGVLPYLLVLGVFAVLLYLQPNMSAIICISVLVFVLMIVGGSNVLHLGITGLAAGGGLYALMFTEGYRVDRIKSFIDPWQYPSNEGYQLIQSLYSLGNAGLFGQGLGNSTQKLLFLPYGESDFIFAIICEELGLFGGLAVIITFGLLVWRGLRVAFRAPDMFGMLCAVGIVTIIAIQVLVNVAVVSGAVPTTGVSMPFISYGSSALIIFMSSIGVLLNISSQTQTA